MTSRALNLVAAGTMLLALLACKRFQRDDKAKPAATPVASTGVLGRVETKPAMWKGSSGEERPLVDLELDNDKYGNDCFPGLSVKVPEGTYVKGEASGACSISDDKEVDLYFEYSLGTSNAFMTLDKRHGAEIIEETKTRLIVKKKKGYVFYDYQQQDDGYRHCSNQGHPAESKELVDELLKICASAKSTKKI